MPVVEPLLVWTFVVLVGLVAGYLLNDRRQQKHAEMQSSVNLRPMGLLSQIWHKLHLRKQSPIIHGFEQFDHNVDFDTFYNFWARMTQDYLTFRCVPYKPKFGNDWYWKELSLDDIDFEGYHIRKVQISSHDFDTNPDQKETRQESPACPRAHDSNCKKTESEVEMSPAESDPLAEAHLALTKFANNLGMSSMWDPNQPHWNAYYITFKEDHLKQFAFGYTRLHHAMGDGILLTKVLQYHHETLAVDSKPSCQPDATKSVPSAHSSWLSRLSSLFTFVSLIPWTLFDFCRFLLFDSAPTCTPISLGYNNLNNLNNKNKDSKQSESHSCNMAVSSALPLEAIKQLSHELKGTINDVVVTLICQGLNTYMRRVLSRDTNGMNGTDGPDAAWNELKKRYGNDLNIRAVSVFNVRSLVARDLDKLVSEFANGVFDNKIAMIAMRLPVGDMKFEDRFEAVKNVFDRIKNGPMPALSTLAIKLVYLLGGADLVVWLMQRTSSQCNILLSNLAGPKQMLPMAVNGVASVASVGNAGNISSGGHVVNMFNCVNPSNMPVNCGVMSYLDKITFALSADSQTMPTPHLLVQCIDDEFERLKQQYTCVKNAC